MRQTGWANEEEESGFPSEQGRAWSWRYVCTYGSGETESWGGLREGGDVAIQRSWEGLHGGADGPLQESLWGA